MVKAEKGKRKERKRMRIISTTKKKKAEIKGKLIKKKNVYEARANKKQSAIGNVKRKGTQSTCACTSVLF